MKRFILGLLVVLLVLGGAFVAGDQWARQRAEQRTATLLGQEIGTVPQVAAHGWPFLLALACSANIGSAATLIGNPQNMLIGAQLKLPFGGYVLQVLVPVLLSLAATWALVAWLMRSRLQAAPVAGAADEARAAAERLLPEGGGKVVVKAQVKTGGRGKAGGVKLADSVDDAEAKARDILGMDIKGHTVHRVMIAPAAAIEEEYYFSVLLDRANRTYLAMASREGGVASRATT